jgi:hypothetical protein
VYLGAHPGYYYDPFFAPYWWYPSPYFWYPPYGYYGYGYAYDPRSGVRIQVTPRETQVYVDGYVAGIVDDFDGTFQRLNLPPGEHEIVLFLAGHRTVRQKVYLTAGDTFRIRHKMEPLSAGERPELPPEPPPTPTPAAPSPGPASPDSSNLPPQPRYPPPAQSAGSFFGALAIRVQPAGADIFIDGERWDASGPGERLTVQLQEGAHRVEIRMQGYEPFSADLHVRRGETATLNVSLSPQPR